MNRISPPFSKHPISPGNIGIAAGTILLILFFCSHPFGSAHKAKQGAIPAEPPSIKDPSPKISVKKQEKQPRRNPFLYPWKTVSSPSRPDVKEDKNMHYQVKPVSPKKSLLLGILTVGGSQKALIATPTATRLYQKGEIVAGSGRIEKMDSRSLICKGEKIPVGAPLP